MPALVLSVGQCGFDDSRISHLLREVCGAAVDRAYTAADAQRMMGEKQYALVLVNRVFDSDGDSGVDFIRGAKAGGHATPMMLVSDYADAQQAAVDAGAAPGFGKGQLGSPGVAELLRAVLSAKAAT
jgi:hypothetical protein